MVFCIVATGIALAFYVPEILRWKKLDYAPPWWALWSPVESLAGVCAALIARVLCLSWLWVLGIGFAFAMDAVFAGTMIYLLRES